MALACGVPARWSAKGLFVILESLRATPGTACLATPSGMGIASVIADVPPVMVFRGTFPPLPSDSRALRPCCISAIICCTVWTGCDGCDIRVGGGECAPASRCDSRRLRAAALLLGWKLPFKPEVGREAAVVRGMPCTDVRSLKERPCPEEADVRSRFGLKFLLTDASDADVISRLGFNDLSCAASEMYARSRLGLTDFIWAASELAGERTKLDLLDLRDGSGEP